MNDPFSTEHIPFEALDSLFRVNDTEEIFLRYWEEFRLLYKLSEGKYDDSVIVYSDVRNLYSVYEMRVKIVNKREVFVHGKEETFRSLGQFEKNYVACCSIITDSRWTATVFFTGNMDRVIGFFYFDRKALKPMPNDGRKPISVKNDLGKRGGFLRMGEQTKESTEFTL